MNTFMMLKLRIFMCLCLGGFSFACSSPQSNARNYRASRNPGVAKIRSTDYEISAIAAREIIRRQGRVRRADAAALRANRYSSQGDHEAAIRSYRQALDTLPSSE